MARSKAKKKASTRELKKLSEESLTRQPEEVFDILNKLGEGSYGSVFKALHKESSQILAIKQVPVDTDLQEIIKEISIMQQCDSPYVVKYYGSYFKNTDLWIVMEYCGAGSVLDIMKLRGIFHGLPRGEVRTLTEEEIATILSDTLKGLEYLHLRKKIHRDIKAGNILLNSEGHAKLADFGVAGQLTDTMAKRNTVIGTPFWMAPEVIQEIGYDCVADIWSLGITSLEMAEGKAPYGEIHPMRAIFMIPSKPPPSFNKPDKWSSAFIDLVSRCLVKNPEERATASQLLQHEFIRQARTPEVLVGIIAEATEMREKLAENVASSFDDTTDSGTMVEGSSGNDNGTLIRTDTASEDGGTMIQHATLVPDRTMTEVESNLGTMVINEDEDDDTMKRHDTKDYRPAFLDHFERKEQIEQEQHQQQQQPQQQQSSQQHQQPVPQPTQPQQQHQQPSQNLQPQQSQPVQLQQQLQQQQPPQPSAVVVHPGLAKPQMAQPLSAANNAVLQKQLERIAGQPVDHDASLSGGAGAGHAAISAAQAIDNKMAKFQKSLLEGDLDFLKYLSYEELTGRMSNLDQEMEREIEDLRRRYHAKRQPIIDAMDQKRKRQQNF